MNLEEVRLYALAKQQVTEGMPFGEGVLVFKVAGKMFLLLPLDATPHHMAVKADPDVAVDQRDRYSGITPAWHMNKKHWNDVLLDGSLPAALLQQMIDDSYNLIVGSLPRKVRDTFI